MNSNNRILVLSEYFEPSTSATAQLSTDLVADLSILSFEPIVLTSTVGCRRSDFKIVRLNNLSGRSSLIFMKTFSGLLFVIRSTLWALINRSQYDQVLIFSNPPFAGIVGLLLKYTCRKKYLFILQDLFPRSASLTGILPPKGPLVSLWKLIVSLVIEHSHSTVVLSDAMRIRAANEYKRPSKLTVVPNWSVLPPHKATKCDLQLTEKWNLDDSLVVQYSGNFGRLHDFMTILEAARLTQDHPIKYLFIGDGAKRIYLDTYTKNYQMKNILLKPFQPRSRLTETLSISDISLVTLVPGAHDTVAPSKLYGILASGRPVLFIGNQNSEIANFILSNNCGFAFDIGDVQGLVSCLLRLLRNRTLLSELSQSAYNAYTNNYGKRKSTSLYATLLRSA